jgi:hypothetical protein
MKRKAAGGNARRGRGSTAAFPHDFGEVSGSPATGADRRWWEGGGGSCTVQLGGERGAGEKQATTALSAFKAPRWHGTMVGAGLRSHHTVGVGGGPGDKGGTRGAVWRRIGDWMGRLTGGFGLLCWRFNPSQTKFKRIQIYSNLSKLHLIQTESSRAQKIWNKIWFCRVWREEQFSL